MGEHVLTNAAVFVGGYDLSGDLQQTRLALDVDMVDKTKMGATARRRMPGLVAGSFDHEGLWEGGADNVDAELFATLALPDVPISMAAEGGADGDVAYLFKGVQGMYAPGAPIGEAFAFSVAGETTERVVRGTVMLRATHTSSGAGTARQLGAVAAGQRMYAALHVTAASGTLPTLDAIVESDDNAGMTSATTRLSFAQATGRTSELLSTDGSAITDDYWRMSFTIAGTAPSFAIACILGIK